MAKGAPDYSNVAGHGISVVLYGNYNGQYQEVAIDNNGAIYVVAQPHATTHQAGGSDEINVAGLSGRLADYQSADRYRTGLDADKPSSGNTEGDCWWSTDTDKLYVWDGSAWKAVGAGIGDMLKSVYDTDDDGVVDNAEALDSLTWDDAEAFFRLVSNKRFSILSCTSLDGFYTTVGGTGNTGARGSMFFCNTGTTGNSYGEIYEGPYLRTENDGDQYAINCNFYSGSGYGTYFVGICYNHPAAIPLNSATYTQIHAGILGYAGNWYASCGDGSNQTKVALSSRPDGWVRFKFTATPSCIFYVNNVQVAEISTNLPTGNTRMVFYVNNYPYAIQNTLRIFSAVGFYSWTP